MSIIYALVGTNRVLRHSNSITIKLLLVISIVFVFLGHPVQYKLSFVIVIVKTKDKFHWAD